jgi:hypothetical protein
MQASVPRRARVMLVRWILHAQALCASSTVAPAVPTGTEFFVDAVHGDDGASGGTDLELRDPVNFSLHIVLDLALIRIGLEFCTGGSVHFECSPEQVAQAARLQHCGELSWQCARCLDPGRQPRATKRRGRRRHWRQCPCAARVYTGCTAVSTRR